MGKRIDRAVIGLACAIGYYLFFLRAWDSIPLACVSAFAACALTRHLIRGLPVRRRLSRAQAWAELKRIAALPDGEAEAVLTSIIEERYPGEVSRIAPVLKHPESTATSGDIMNAWKANRDADRLAIVTTCPCEARAALYAQELRSPAVAVIDSRALTGILRRRSAEKPPATPSPGLRARLRLLFAAIATARVTPRNGLLAAVLLSAYLLTGNPWCLFPGLTLLAHLGIALAHRRFGRRRLFEI